MSKIAIIATLNTKASEVDYIKNKIVSYGFDAFIIDSSLSYGEYIDIEPNIRKEEVAKAAGYDFDTIASMQRGRAIDVMKIGLASVLTDVFKRKLADAVISIGGADGALLSSYAIQQLPIDIPKLIVTPIAQGKEKFGPYVGTSNIMIMHSIVDILGINYISKKIFDLAVAAIVGMAKVKFDEDIRRKKRIAVTMYGNTTPLVMKVRDELRNVHYNVYRDVELVIFHPNGTGGSAMEELVNKGEFDVVLDITPHEITDYLFNGIHAGRSTRLEAAALKGIPQIIVPGCIDFIVKESNIKTKNRKTYYFNPALQLVKVNEKEIEIIAKYMAEKLNLSKNKTIILIPLKGFSQYDKEGYPLYDPLIVKSFVDTIEKSINNKNVEIREVGSHVNDSSFAHEIVNSLLYILKGLN